MNRPALAVFLILWASYAYFWHGRDWNTASRLMLTYAVVDRGTIQIDGLDDQTGDKARYRNHYYSDKLPGYSFLAVPGYAALKRAFHWPPHPLNQPGFAHWPADYGVTLLTSGLLTAVAGGLLVVMAGWLGCGPRASVVVGLTYGLATPAYAYATLAYGHQASAACLLGSFALLWRERRRRFWLSSALAGFLAALASVVEIQVGPVSAILGLYALALVISGRRPVESVIAYALGALVPTAFLLVYNDLAFDSPFRMGYFFHATARFKQVHSAANPLGLGAPDWTRLDDLLIGQARGLFWYAPIALLTIPGLLVLIARKSVGMAVVCGATIAAVLLVNLSYPEWTGGWSTGPRLLVPALPFMMLPVAAILASGRRVALGSAIVLGVAGWVVVTLFQGVGARVPDPPVGITPGRAGTLSHPLFDALPPIWRGDPLPGWVFGRRFARNLGSLALPNAVAALPPSRQWLQFVPLLGFQVVATLALVALTRRREPPVPDATGGEPPPARPDRP